MPSTFRVPGLFRSRSSLRRLRSFHLSPEANARLAALQATMGGTSSQLSNTISRPTPANLVIPLRGSTIVTLAIIASLFFIMSISFAFLGADVEDPYFKNMLNNVASNSPGIVLIGESVDVDVDEPSITIRWSILACGSDYVLPESTGVHGSIVCGLPSKALYIFVDNADKPTATYDPSTIPVNKETGHRRNIQNLVQFDSDHVIDVHQARLYPFDTYFLTSTLRAIGFSNESIPIQKLATVDIMSSFDIGTADVESFSQFENGTVIPSRDIDMHVARPGSARFFALLLFTVSWILTHVTIGHVLMARRLAGIKPILKHLVSSGAIVIAIPQLRNSMPDAPGFDGVLIDTIGYFPQMVIASIATITLLLILAVREFDLMGLQAKTQPGHHGSMRLLSPSMASSITYSPPLIRTFTGDRDSSVHSPSHSVRHSRPPPPPNRYSTPAEIADWERHRMTRHLTGQFVFPPVQTVSATAMHRSQASSQTTVRPVSHKKVMTMTRIMEAGEVVRSQWSDEE